MKHLRLLLALSLACIASVSTATDLSITASSFLPSSDAKYANGICGEAIGAGQLVYVSASDGRYYKADADDSTKYQVAGISGHATTAAGQPIALIYEDPRLTVGATLSMVAPVYVLSDTAGGIAPSADIGAGFYPVIVGVAVSTTKMYFKPRAIQGDQPAVGADAFFDLGDAPRFALLPPPHFKALAARCRTDLALVA